jgi:REP element-mobilizing transposase RayT
MADVVLLKIGNTHKALKTYSFRVIFQDISEFELMQWKNDISDEYFVFSIGTINKKRIPQG